MHLYLHIPFCHRTCPYCSFYKHTPGGTDIPRFIDALVREARFRASPLSCEGGGIRTLYLGGGTPSFLSRVHLRRLFDGLRETLDLRSLREVTLEANPATFGEGKAMIFKELGVSRVSLGVQSFSSRVLETLGRDHSPEDASEAFRILRAAGIPSVNIDLMFSVPGQRKSDWEATLRQTLLLQPDHVSAYNLTYEEDTAFLKALKAGEMDDSGKRDARHFLLARRLLSSAGFRHYETSNYALSGHESLHNQAYWHGHPYIGLGPSSVSTLPEPGHARACRRSRNIPDTSRYMESVEARGHAIEGEEPLGSEAFRLERLALMLRMDTGLPRCFLVPENRPHIETLLGKNMAELTPTHLVPKGRGLLHIDSIAALLA